MASRTNTDTGPIMITMDAILQLAPVVPIPREQLEDAVMEVEEALDQHALELTDGASASANFENGWIEIDLRLTGATVGELHQKIALIVTQLDQYCSLSIGPLPGQAFPRSPLTVQASATQLVPA
jgi:hypothetical protein